jgi:hypothetical protein
LHKLSFGIGQRNSCARPVPRPHSILQHLDNVSEEILLLFPSRFRPVLCKLSYGEPIVCEERIEQQFYFREEVVIGLAHQS